MGTSLGCGQDGGTDGSENADADESGDADGDSDGDAGDAGTDGQLECPATPPSIEGPFYRDGIPIRADLDLYGDEGGPLHLSGLVQDESCAPIAGAVIEFWHATPATPGVRPGGVNATYDTSGELRYYGQVATDDEGRYELRTLIPGWYLHGAAYRPAHIHVKIWVGDVERLTTQLYFANDPFNVGDPWFDPETVLNPDGEGIATYDFAV